MDAGTDGLIIPDISDILDSVDYRLQDPDTGPVSEQHAENFTDHKKRKAWGGSASQHRPEPRCDFAPNRNTITAMPGFRVISVWKKSPMGKRLSQIKDSEDMPHFFADAVASMIRSVIGDNPAAGGWVLTVPPPRRHKERNFATVTAIEIAGLLGIRFVSLAKAHKLGRVNAEYTLAHPVPDEPNIIIFDDIVTTGSTLCSMHRLLKPFGKNLAFFAGIKNHS
ncbi:MAG: hypothetical protein HDS67_02300 [Bacteroidales bacterium]|nr:hypothetical protein [Bacteroidales bacterium]